MAVDLLHYLPHEISGIVPLTLNLLKLVIKFLDRESMTFLSNLLLGSLKLDLSDLVPEPVLVVVDLCRVLIDIHVHDLDLPALVLSPICLEALERMLLF